MIINNKKYIHPVEKIIGLNLKKKQNSAFEYEQKFKKESESVSFADILRDVTENV